MVANALAQVPNLMMQIPAGFEWVILLVIIVVVFFGVKKMPELAKSVGRAKSEYEEIANRTKKRSSKNIVR